MSVVTLWLLISFVDGPTHVVERFASQTECQRVAEAMYRPDASVLKCVQANVAVATPARLADAPR